MNRTPEDAERVTRTETVGTGAHLVGQWIMWPTVDDGDHAVLVEEVTNVTTAEGVPDPEVLIRFAPISTETHALAYPDESPTRGPRWTRLCSSATVAIAHPDEVAKSKLAFQVTAGPRRKAADIEASLLKLRWNSRQGVAIVAGLAIWVGIDVVFRDGSNAPPYLYAIGAVLISEAILWRWIRKIRRSLVAARVREGILSDLAAGAPVRLHSVMGGHLWGVEGQPFKPGATDRG